MPVSVWKQMIDMYYPGTGWMRLDPDVLSAVAAYRTEHGLTSWEETITHLLDARTGVPP